MWLLFDQKHENSENILEHVADISVEEAEKLQNFFHFSGAYVSAVMMQDVVIRNGSLFLHHMDPQHLNRYEKNRNDAIAIANQFAFNYATSLKTFIDICERQLRKDCSLEQLEVFQASQRTFYDTYVEYRFWMRLRNFVVHCGFPYTHLIHNDNGLQVQCCKKHLLTFRDWSTVKKDFETMGEYIVLENMVPQMNTCIATLRLVFVAQYAEHIANASKAYSTFCSKHAVENPTLGYVDNIEAFKRGQVTLYPLPLDKLVDAIADLKQIV